MHSNRGLKGDRRALLGAATATGTARSFSGGVMLRKKKVERCGGGACKEESC